MPRLEPFVEHLPQPERGRVRLSRWLEALTSPETGYAQLESVPLLARTFALLLATSPDVATMVQRNPELGFSALDLDTDYVSSGAEAVRDEVRRLTSHTVSYAHRLDRLRFLKDKRTLLTAMCDVGGFLAPRVVWKSISDLAEGLLVEAAEAVWQETAPTWGLPPASCVGIVAFGKLGGRELNYSSDVDLAFVVPDDTSDAHLAACQKFCERFRSAVSDKMGRGALYRVDLRLRPFGTQGPTVNRFGTSAHYYQTYAEPWEHLALVRSRVIAGWPGLNDQWEDLRARTAFSPIRGEWVLDNLRHLRQRTMDFGGEGDLKRGRGGIRDVEFLVQVHQLLLGGRFPELRVRHTLDALSALEDLGWLEQSEHQALADGYAFLRQVEHRCQLREGQQTHELPADPTERGFIAATLGLDSAESLSSRLAEVRDEVHAVYQRRMPDRTNLPRLLSRELETWIGRLPQPHLYFAILAENHDSIDRLEQVVRHAPTVLGDLATSASVTEEVISGEICEGISLPNPKTDLTTAARTSWLRAASLFALSPEFDAANYLSQRAHALLARLAEGLDLSVLALGSLANQELSWWSDLDVLLVGSDTDAAEFLARCDRLAAAGGFIRVDTRLRPDGRKGSVATTLDRIRRYADEMDPWERFAFSQAVLVTGDPETVSILHSSAVRQLSQPERDDLHHVYQRLVHERTSNEGRNRSLKLAEGGLNDFQWAVHLQEIAKWPAERGGDGALVDRAESENLKKAHQELMTFRHGLGLLDRTDDFFPGEGAKLNLLAELLGDTPAGLLVRFETSKAVVRDELAAQWKGFLDLRP